MQEGLVDALRRNFELLEGLLRNFAETKANVRYILDEAVERKRVWQQQQETSGDSRENFSHSNPMVVYKSVFLKLEKHLCEFRYGKGEIKRMLENFDVR